MVQLCTAPACSLAVGSLVVGPASCCTLETLLSPEQCPATVLLRHLCAITADAITTPSRTRMRRTSNGPCMEQRGRPVSTRDRHCPCLQRTGMPQQTPLLASLCCFQRNPVGQAARAWRDWRTVAGADTSTGGCLVQPVQDGAADSTPRISGTGQHSLASCASERAGCRVPAEQVRGHCRLESQGKPWRCRMAVSLSWTWVLGKGGSGAGTPHCRGSRRSEEPWRRAPALPVKLPSECVCTEEL